MGITGTRTIADDEGVIRAQLGLAILDVSSHAAPYDRVDRYR